jgi:uncharacterized protein
MHLLLAACLALAGLLSPAWADVAIPPLAARVTDLTGTLNAQQKGELESRLAAFEAKRGSQVVVLVLPTTRPEEIEQFSIRLAEAWKIGRKGVDDGVILVVAKDDRTLRIEVGYGLEGVIPDAVARRVIEERITPRFREGDFFGGIRDGVDQLLRLAEGEKLPEPAARGSSRDPVSSLFDYVVPALFFIVIAGGVLKLVLGRFLGSVATGALLGLAAFLLLNAIAAAVAAVMGFLFTFANTGAGRGGGGWSSSGGSSSSSGSFGGGGGSFGGGGASGRW